DPVLEPGPRRVADAAVEIEEPLRQIAREGLHGAVPLEGAEVSVVSEERVRPRSCAREAGDLWQHAVEEIAREALPAGLAGAPDNGSESPEDPAVAVFGSLLLEPPSRVRHEVAESAALRVERV